MIEQSEVVQKALDALRTVCIAEPKPIRCIAEPKPIRASEGSGWLVNGKRVTVFPHCPRCASYALYRKDNIGDYECLTCGLLEIDESTARRLV